MSPRFLLILRKKRGDTLAQIPKSSIQIKNMAEPAVPHIHANPEASPAGAAIDKEELVLIEALQSVHKVLCQEIEVEGIRQDAAFELFAGAHIQEPGPRSLLQHCEKLLRGKIPEQAFQKSPSGSFAGHRAENLNVNQKCLADLY